MKCAKTAWPVSPFARVVFLAILVAVLGIPPLMAASTAVSTGRQAASGTGASTAARGPATSPQVAALAPAAPLQPEELLLVYNGNDPRSRELAEYYSTARNVPMDRLCPVSVKLNQEEIAREQYDRLIREPVRAFLEQHAQGRRIRCIVLFYGVPIRVGPTFSRLITNK